MDHHERDPHYNEGANFLGYFHQPNSTIIWQARRSGGGGNRAVWLLTFSFFLLTLTKNFTRTGACITCHSIEMINPIFFRIYVCMTTFFYRSVTDNSYPPPLQKCVLSLTGFFLHPEDDPVYYWTGTTPPLCCAHHGAILPL